MIADKVFKELENYLREEFLVVGVGNQLRGDDEIGSYIAKKGYKKFPHKFLDAGFTPENYIFKIIKRPEKRILFVDCIDFGEEVGSMKIFSPSEISEQGISSHSLSLAKICDILKDAGKKVLIFGFQGKNINIGDRISKELKRSADYLLEYLLKLLEKSNA